MCSNNPVNTNAQCSATVRVVAYIGDRLVCAKGKRWLMVPKTDGQHLSCGLLATRIRTREQIIHLSRKVKMTTSISKKVSISCVLALIPFAFAGADDENMESYHLGFMYPNGADIAGYTVEHKINGSLYRFYTFGFPSVASIGLTYYANYEGNGITTSFGVGLGYLSMIHGSIAYQWKMKETDYVKLGVGFATTLVYNGAFPVLSYEHRFH